MTDTRFPITTQDELNDVIRQRLNREKARRTALLKRAEHAEQALAEHLGTTVTPRREPDHLIDSPDGVIAIWQPTDPSGTWRSMTWETGHKPVEVAWDLHTYSCAQCATGNNYRHCKHTWAAVAASIIATNRTEGEANDH